MNSTTDKQNCPTLSKILSPFTAFGILSSTLQNHCYYQHKPTCCPWWLDQTGRIHEAHQRPALCSKSTGMQHTLISIWDKPWGSDTDRESYVSCLYQWVHHNVTVAVCKKQPVLQPDPSCRLTPLGFPAFSHQAPGSVPHINQRLPPPWALAFLPALSLLKEPSQPNALCKGVGHLWIVTHS